MTMPPEQDPKASTARKRFWIGAIIVSVVAVIGQQMIDDSRSSSSANAPSMNVPSPATPVRTYSIEECDRAEIQFWASVNAKETLEAEGRLTTDLQRFHNDQIVESGDILEACGRL